MWGLDPRFRITYDHSGRNKPWCLCSQELKPFLGPKMMVRLLGHGGVERYLHVVNLMVDTLNNKYSSTKFLARLGSNFTLGLQILNLPITNLQSTTSLGLQHLHQNQSSHIVAPPRHSLVHRILLHASDLSKTKAGLWGQCFSTHSNVPYSINKSSWVLSDALHTY